MAKKSFFTNRTEKSVPSVTPVESSVKPTASRYTSVPKVTPRREVTREMIAARAYEIYLSGSGADELGNWLQAERELNSL